MRKIEDEEAMGVARCAGQSDTSTATARSYIGFINSDISRAIASGRDKARTLSSALIDKSHISVGRVRILLKLAIMSLET